MGLALGRECILRGNELPAGEIRMFRKDDKSGPAESRLKTSFVRNEQEPIGAILSNTPVAPESPWRIQSLRAFRRARIVASKGCCVDGFLGFGGLGAGWLLGRLVGRSAARLVGRLAGFGVGKLWTRPWHLFGAPRHVLDASSVRPGDALGTSWPRSWHSVG